ncbi:MAG: DNA gyrase subunit A, partial [Holosporales bacterium]|nr:DNA gyrase subunit A [Holosporales bacterium]
MQRSYLDYAMSVIVSRALPDARDGLKPVHRRIIYSMNENGNHYTKPYRKSMRIVGDVLGKFHPHGDAAVYETMVRLAQDFSLRVPLVDGQGNFGSMDGDSAAAPRYTEARMALIAHELVADIEDDTVNFVPNYDNTLLEPSVLPARFPNLIVNGAGGIAVGMATYIPTHNLGEVIDACFAIIDNPEISVDELIQNYIPGPDFPTGGIVMGNRGVKNAFETGRGSVIVRSKTSIIKSHGDRETIIVHEIPYQVNKAKLVEKIAELVKEKTVEGISDIRDESNKDGVRIVIELKKDAIGEVILNQLFKFTPLQTSFGYNMLALVKKRPLRLSLKEIINHFLEFRQEVVVRRSKFNLKKCRGKAHILLGFALAIANIDRVIEIIRGASDRNEAKENLMAEV